MVLQLQQRARDQSRQGRVERHGHAAAHRPQEILHERRLKLGQLGDRQKHEDEAHHRAEQAQLEQHVAQEVAHRMPIEQLIPERVHQGRTVAGLSLAPFPFQVVEETADGTATERSPLGVGVGLEPGETLALSGQRPGKR